MGESLERSNPLREGIAAYTRCAGIETGYGFFAPKVAITRKLVFQIRYADGRVEYELPRVGGSGTGVRLTLLFENIAHLEYRPLRETVFKMMAFSIRREHPDASVIRAVFGVVNLPSLSDFNSNKEPTYDVLYAYDFRFPAVTEPAAP